MELAGLAGMTAALVPLSGEGCAKADSLSCRLTPQSPDLYAGVPAVLLVGDAAASGCKQSTCLSKALLETSNALVHSSESCNNMLHLTMHRCAVTAVLSATCVARCPPRAEFSLGLAAVGDRHTEISALRWGSPLIAAVVVLLCLSAASSPACHIKPQQCLQN